MRALEMALTALALRAAPTRPPQSQRRLVPAVDDAIPAVMDRAALSQQRAALIASLWPAARQCVVPPRYAQYPAPAQLGGVLRVDWPAADARALQQKLRAIYAQQAPALAPEVAQRAA